MQFSNSLSKSRAAIQLRFKGAFGHYVANKYGSLLNASLCSYMRKRFKLENERTYACSQVAA